MSYYVPILKWKEGEKRAFEVLDPTSKTRLTPLLEITDQIEPQNFINDISRCGISSMYIDTLNAEDDGDLLLSLVKESIHNGKDPFPVVLFDDIGGYADEVSQGVNRIGVRIPLPEDLEEEDYDFIFNSLVEWKKKKDIQLDLILDLGWVKDNQHARIAYAELKNVINNYVIDKKEHFGHIIIAMTSFPTDLSALEAGKSMIIDRLEIKIFNKLMRVANFNEIKDSFIYSDYGVTRFTDTEIDFSKLKYGILPKARYTVDGGYWVLKGQRDQRTRQMIKNHIVIANEIYRSQHYRGETFSFGDLDIKERALGYKGPGNNTNWVTIAANHHIAVVLEELSNLYVS